MSPSLFSSNSLSFIYLVLDLPAFLAFAEFEIPLLKINLKINPHSNNPNKVEPNINNIGASSIQSPVCSWQSLQLSLHFRQILFK